MLTPARLRVLVLSLTLTAPSVILAGNENKISAEVFEKALQDGAVAVLVGLNVPWQREDTLSLDAVHAQRLAIEAAQKQLLIELNGTRHKVIRQYHEIPGIALDIGADAVTILEQSPTVTNVLADRPVVASVEDNRSPILVTTQSEENRPAGKVPVELFENARSGATVLVLVGLKAPWRPEGILSEAMVSVQRNAIAASQDYLLAELSDTQYRITRRFQKIPGIALEVGLDALKILDRSAAVTNVLSDRPAKR